MRHAQGSVDGEQYRRDPDNHRSNPLPGPVAGVGLLLALAYWLVQSLYDTFAHHASFLDMLLPHELSILLSRLFATLTLLILIHLANRVVNRARPLLPYGGQHQQEEVAYLSKTAVEFIDLPLDEDIYQYIGEHIKELVGDGVVIVNSFDEGADALRVRTILGGGPLIEAAVRALGRHPVGLAFPVTEEARQGITKGILEKAEGGLYEACFGKINKDLCHRLEYLAGVNEVYGVGFARKGGIFGDALIITRKGNPPLNQGLIEAFVNQASMALHRHKAEDELRGLSLVDELTCLYNRRGFLTLAEQQLKIANRMQRPMLMLFVDLDYLKSINDTFGHQEGDKAINEIGRIMKRNFRDADIVARLGGDEFVVLVVEAGGATPDMLISRLQSTIDARNACEGMRYQLSMSIGVELYDPKHPCTIDELLQRADLAMYEQKRNRRQGLKTRT
ncbi:MAG: GGDEF domain-containing protein [Armatimonadota bacterium]